MTGRWGVVGLCLLLAGEAWGEGVPVGGAAVEDGWWGGFALSLELGAVVPWRVYTLDAPRRLVLEMQGVEWQAGAALALMEGGNATGARVEAAPGGWTRLTLDLAGPVEVAEAGLRAEGDGARLRLVLEGTSEEAFSAAAQALPEGVLPEPGEPARDPRDDGRFVVAIDPGHGGIDPGAERGGLTEADVMLALGVELAAAVERAGMVAVLTRDADVFVPLQERITRARAGGADVMLSLHADALEEDAARGASVYTLTREAVDAASERMVERHEGGDLIAGLDLRGEGDEVATALMDLAREGTVPRSERLAGALAREIAEAGAAVNGRPLRQANLAVLAAADFPSVLLESGFLSDAADRERLASPEGRAALVRGIVAALEAWAGEEAR